MSDRAWKAWERTLARLLGGRRVPITGRARGDVPDISHPWLAIEAKVRREIPFWLEDALRQAEASAGPTQPPIAVIHKHRTAHGQALVVLRLRDWLDWFGSDDLTEGVVQA